MAVCPDFTLQMIMQSSGWQTLEGEPTYKRGSAHASTDYGAIFFQFLLPLLSFLLFFTQVDVP